MAALQGNRVRLQNRIPEERTQRTLGIESHAPTGRSVAALSRSHRSAGAPIWNAAAASRPSNPHGFRASGCKYAGDGERVGVGSFAALRFVKKFAIGLHG